MKQPAVYMVASGFNGTIYTGVTSDLVDRVGAHRTGVRGGVGGRLGCRVVVGFEVRAWVDAGVWVGQAVVREVEAPRVVERVPPSFLGIGAEDLTTEPAGP